MFGAYATATQIQPIRGIKLSSMKKWEQVIPQNLSFVLKCLQAELQKPLLLLLTTKTKTSNYRIARNIKRRRKREGGYAHIYQTVCGLSVKQRLCHI